MQTDDIRHELDPLNDPRDLDDDTDVRYSPEAVEQYRESPEEFAEKYPEWLHHYNQTTGDWGGTEEVCTILDRLDLDPEELTVTVFGGFTGEFARALRDAGCEVIFIDPMAEWVDRAEAEGFEAYACSAEMIPTDVLTRTDAFATFECYYPLGGDPGEVLYTVLRMLSAPHGILFAETPTTREFRRENGAKRASLPQFKTLEEQLGTEYRYRETGDLRVYQYVQPERERSSIGRQAMILRHLYELGSNDEELIVDSGTVAQLVELTDLDTLEIEIYLDEILLLYRQLCGELAEFLPPGRLEVFDRQFRIQLL